LDAKNQRASYFQWYKTTTGHFGHHEQIAYPQIADDWQRANGVEGAVGEIGVFLGDYLFGLGVCARPDERIVAIDLFEDQRDNIDGSGKHDKGLDHFRKRYKDHIANGARLNFVKGDSLFLTPADLLKASDGQKYRLFSIDGGHTHYHTINDILLAEAVLCHGGVIIVDDYTNAGWPGVAEGVARYFLQSPRRHLAPVLSQWNKLILTTESRQRELLDYFDSRVPDSQRHLAKRERLFGFEILVAQGFSEVI
jgi:hypothetical protein